MAAQNPKKALAALLPAPIPIEGMGESVRPITLAAFALLARIGSPLLFDGAPADPLAVLPSLYVLCRGAADALEGNLLDKAVAWADTMPPSALAAIKAAAERQVAAIADVVPEAKADDVKKKGTAGRPPSPSGPAEPTGGRPPRRSTKSPPRPSRSSSASGRSARV